MTQLDLTNMTLNDIDIETITNTEGTGIFDKLMSAVNDNVTVQFNEGRINNTDFANVYLGSIQAVLAQSVQFALQEQLTEAQIATAIADKELKDKQLEIADIEKALKQYELDNILPEQLESAYTDRVIKDKQAAKLGLDNVMRNSDASRDSDADFVYSPKYIKPSE